MRILVTGGCGYIGTLLSNELFDLGYGVSVIDECWFGNKLNADISVNKKNLFECSVDDLKGYDQIIFLAGLSNDPMAEFRTDLNFIHNTALPTYLAYVAKQAGVKRFIYGSSCSIYGYACDRFYKEDDPVYCEYPYGISKYQGEVGARQLCDNDFSVIALRQGTVCGYSRRMRFDLVVNAMYKSAKTTGEITVNNPDIWRPILDIRDCVNAYIRCVNSDFNICGSFNVASGNYQVWDIADKISHYFYMNYDRIIKINTHHRQDKRNYRVDCSLAEDTFGFEPKHDIYDMVDSIDEVCREYDTKRFDKDIYYNIKTFEKLCNDGKLDRHTIA